MSVIAAAWLTAPETRAVIAALDAVRPGASRFVGGCVRNTLMGLAADDIDIATQLTPDQVIAAGERAGLGVAPTGLAHGTVTLIAAHKPFEITTLRRDVSTDGRRATVAFTEDWAEDSARRDFRLNALYAEPDGALHDPTGGGIEDARAGRVLFIGEAEQRIREDYLRILRFFRFNAWYARGPLDPAGLQACAALREGMRALSAERVWKEIKKMLAAADPRAAYGAMEQSGVRTLVLPEANDVARFELLVAADAANGFAPDAMQRLAALLPDDPDVARALAQRLKLSNDERLRLVQALTPAPEPFSAADARRLLYAMGAQAFEDRVRLEGGDPALAHAARAYARPRLKLTGDDLIAAGVAPGPAVGQAMRAIEQAWIAADFPEEEAWVRARVADYVAK